MQMLINLPYLVHEQINRVCCCFEKKGIVLKFLEPLVQHYYALVSERSRGENRSDRYQGFMVRPT